MHFDETKTPTEINLAQLECIFIQLVTGLRTPSVDPAFLYFARKTPPPGNTRIIGYIFDRSASTVRDGDESSLSDNYDRTKVECKRSTNHKPVLSAQGPVRVD
jgi:hypothetical protein